MSFTLPMLSRCKHLCCLLVLYCNALIPPSSQVLFNHLITILVMPSHALCIMYIPYRNDLYPLGYTLYVPCSFNVLPENVTRRLDSFKACTAMKNLWNAWIWTSQQRLVFQPPVRGPGLVFIHWRCVVGPPPCSSGLSGVHIWRWTGSSGYTLYCRSCKCIKERIFQGYKPCLCSSIPHDIEGYDIYISYSKSCANKYLISERY